MILLGFFLMLLVCVFIRIIGGRVLLCVEYFKECIMFIYFMIWFRFEFLLLGLGKEGLFLLFFFVLLNKCFDRLNVKMYIVFGGMKIGWIVW